MEAARTVALADQEQEPLLIDQPAIHFADRQPRIPHVDRFAADAIDLDDREALAARQRVDGLEPQVEPAVVEFGHAAGDAVDTALHLRGDKAASVAVEGAGALVADQRDLHHLACSRHARQFLLAETAMRRVAAEMQLRFPARAGILADQIADRFAAIADHMREIAERQRQHAAVPLAGQTRIEDRRLTGIRHIALQDDVGVFRETGDVILQFRETGNAPHAVTMPADIRLGDERVGDALCLKRRLRRLDIGIDAERALPASHHREIGDPGALLRCDIEQIIALGFAPHAAGENLRIGGGWQREAAVPQAESDPAQDQRQIKQHRRNSLRDCQLAIADRQFRHAVMTVDDVRRGRRAFDLLRLD